MDHMPNPSKVKFDNVQYKIVVFISSNSNF